MNNADTVSWLAIVLAEGELTQWRHNSIGIAALERSGLKVAYFDCESLVRPNHEQVFGAGPLYSELLHLQKLLDTHRIKFVFSYYELSDRRLKPIRDLLEARGVAWCRVYCGFVPPQSSSESFRARVGVEWFRVLRLARQGGVLRALAKTVGQKILRLLRLKVGEHAPKYVLLEGLAARDACRHGEAIPIMGHSRDFEHALAAGLLHSGQKAEDYCVFLDSNEVRHEDFGILGFDRRDVVDEDWYRQALQRSFKVIEDVTGLRVVIAPHPRYQYPEGYFGPYELRASDTAHTVASSKLVIGHYSTSIGLAVIFSKPVILLNSTPMLRLAGGFTGRYIKGFQRALGCPMLNMDHPDPSVIQDWTNIDQARYFEFRDRYVKYPGSLEISMWENAVRTIVQHEGWDI
jgi:hypothetical protein